MGGEVINLILQQITKRELYRHSSWNESNGKSSSDDTISPAFSVAPNNWFRHTRGYKLVYGRWMIYTQFICHVAFGFICTRQNLPDSDGVLSIFRFFFYLPHQWWLITAHKKHNIILFLANTHRSAWKYDWHSSIGCRCGSKLSPQIQLAAIAGQISDGPNGLFVSGDANSRNDGIETRTWNRTDCDCYRFVRKELFTDVISIIGNDTPITDKHLFTNRWLFL